MPTILIVDDDPALRTMVRQMLAPLPYSIREAGHGVEALAWMRHERP